MNRLSSLVIGMLSFLLYVLTVIYVMVVMYMVYKHIRDIEKKAQAYTFTSHRSSDRTIRATERKRSQRVMIQGVMYAVALLLVFIPFSVRICLSSFGGIESFAMTLLAGILVPLQGMYNAIIYSGKLQNWWYNNENQCRLQCCSCIDVSISSLRTSVKKLFVSTTIVTSSAEDVHQGKSGEKDTLVRFHDDISPDMKSNMDSSLLDHDDGNKNSEPMEKGVSCSSHDDTALVEKKKDHILPDEEMIDEEEKEEIIAQFPIHVPPCSTLEDDGNIVSMKSHGEEE